jgi:hypothetical protein
MKSSGRVRKMAVSLRERPRLQGRDLERFIQKANANEQSMKAYAAKKVEEYNDRYNKK